MASSSAADATLSNDFHRLKLSSPSASPNMNSSRTHGGGEDGAAGGEGGVVQRKRTDSENETSSSHHRRERDRSGGGGLQHSKSIVDKERKIGHRRVDGDGQVSYKKIQSSQLMQSIQLGIQYSIGAMSRHDERDLLMQDFYTVETVSFPKSGSKTTPAHSFSDFTFRTVAPLAFRYFLNLFGIKREDFMMSLCSEAMRELSNPGVSGSIFYLTHDDELILKTVQHKEAEFLQKLLAGYYMNLNQNPHTLLPKFFGMYCYQCNQKNIRLTVMNNLLPSNVKMHLKFDLKGSTYKRKANKHERAKASPTFKDLDFMEMLPDGLLLEQETYNALISTLWRDCRVLESFFIMDYSLLVGIHNLDQAAREDAEADNSSPAKEKKPPTSYKLKQPRYLKQPSQQKPKLVAHSTAMESIQAQTEPIDEQEDLPPGGIPARNHKGERILLFIGIIDILQSYRMRKKLEHTFKAIIHDGDTVSVHRPDFYSKRFLDFMGDKVFKKIPSPLKHSPSRKSKRDSFKKTSVMSPSSTGANAAGGGPAGTAAAAAGATAAAASTSSDTESKTAPLGQQQRSVNGGSAAADAAPVAAAAAVVAVGGGEAAASAEAAGAASAEATGAASAPSSAEMMHLPAVLWDRPATKSKKANNLPVVQPRSSHTGPSHGHVHAGHGQGADNVQSSSSSSAASSTRTVVQRGAGAFDKSNASASASASASAVVSTTPSRPRNRLHDTVKQNSDDYYGSLDRDRNRDRDRDRDHSPSSGDHGTPSRLSVGAGSSPGHGGRGWNTPTPTPTWTEGTPSFTESTSSGELIMGASAAAVSGNAGCSPGRRSNHTSRESVVITRNYKDTPYHETEITRL